MFMTKISNSLHVRYKIMFTFILKYAKVLNSTLFSFLFLPFFFLVETVNFENEIREKNTKMQRKFCTNI